jgi:predicted nucleic acid-binding protein
MTGRSFVDTNILVYGQDGRDPAKQRRAQQLAAELVESGTGVISTQVMQEFYVTVTGKLRLAPAEAKAVLRTLAAFEIVQVTPGMVQEAVDCAVLNKISFWDALIIVAAETAGCTTLYSEDLGAGQTILGVKVVNPFVVGRSDRPK